MPGNQAPDVIKADTKGNVYAGCRDGVSVWSPGGFAVGEDLARRWDWKFGIRRGRRAVRDGKSDVVENQFG
jgi:hypothetical protein